ncbi:MAG TPA: FxsA family protein [Solirubrobacterales bacterium]
MPLLLILLFIVVPIAELYVIIKVGELIGVVPTLLILLGDALLGSLLLRQQGRAAWRRFNQALAERRFPGREVADGLLITIGGTLLLTPGFISDVFGLILLVPPTRALVRRMLWLLIGRRFRVVTGPAAWGYGPERRREWPGTGRPPGSWDVEGSAQEVPPQGPEDEESRRRPLPPP